MGFEQYHEPPQELSDRTRTFARMCANLTEEAEAIGWYEQRISLETDPMAKAIMQDSLSEEFKHFCMELEFLLRATPAWRTIARGTLFQEGDIVAHGHAAEEAAEAEAGAAGGTSGARVGSTHGASAGAGRPGGGAGGGGAGRGGSRSGPAPSAGGGGAAVGSLGIGSLKGRES